VKKANFTLIGLALAMSLMLAGCQHRLIAAPGETSVAIYPDEQTFLKIADLKKQGGMAGMIGGLGQNFASKQVDNNTPVKIVSSDDQGYVVQVTDGPNAGTSGFVPKSSVQ
jgi:hypothetical protein